MTNGETISINITGNLLSSNYTNEGINKGNIQEVIIGYVTTIGHSAFYYCSALQSVTIPDSVTYIGYSALESCTALQSVFMTDVVRINLGISNFVTGQSFYGATNANIIDKLL